MNDRITIQEYEDKLCNNYAKQGEEYTLVFKDYINKIKYNKSISIGGNVTKTIFHLNKIIKLKIKKKNLISKNEIHVIIKDVDKFPLLYYEESELDINALKYKFSTNKEEINSFCVYGLKSSHIEWVKI